MLKTRLMGKRLRVGFVGCGEHARTNLYPCLPSLPVDLIAVCARRRDSAERAARTFGASSFYDDFQEMFSKERLDAVFVCVRAEEHFRIASAAVNAGLHVFLEKPATASLQECEALEQLAARRERHVMVGLMKRHAPAYRKAMEIVRSPSFGPISAIDTKLCVGPLADIKHFLREVGLHHLDLVRFFAGEIQALHVEKHLSSRSEAFTLALVCRFGNGAVGSLLMSTEQSWRGHNERVEIAGEGQSIVIDNVASLKHYRPSLQAPARDAFAGAGHEFWEPNFTVPTGYNQSLHINGFAPEVEHFVTSLLSGHKPAPGLSDFRENLKVIGAIVELLAESRT